MKDFEFKPLRRFVIKGVPTREGSGSGNRHTNARRPNGPVCGQPIRGRGGEVVTFCAARWEPVCSNPVCPGNKEPRRVMRIERYGHRRGERHDKGGSR